MDTLFENSNAFLLTLMTLLPLVTGIGILFSPGTREDAPLARAIALSGTVVTFLVSLVFLGGILGQPGQYTAAINIPLISQYNIRFAMGLDGLSGVLVLLTNVLMILSVLGSWTAITRRAREFYFFLLMLQTGIIGTFLAMDLILFYVYWELMLIPLYFLIGIFGSGNRIYATMKFFLYTMAGSLLMLLGILALYFQHTAIAGVGSFMIGDLLKIAPQIEAGHQFWIYLSFALAFCIKVPLFPLHTWLPDAHTEAPTAGSVILAGVLLKTGVYGLLRFAMPLFPAVAAETAPVLATLAIIAIIYGALTAFAQTDMKRLVAYSSVSHMGFIVLGLAAFQTEAIAGAALQMVAHGVSTGGLFLCVGYLYERRHTRELSQFGGLAYNMKVYAVLTMIMVLASVGLPGLCGFVGEFMILMGTGKTNFYWAGLAGIGVILAACYLLRMTQLTFFGPLDKEENKALKDLNPREAFTLVVLAALALWIGVYPNPILRAFNPVSEGIAASVHEADPSWGNPVIQAAMAKPAQAPPVSVTAPPAGSHGADAHH